MLDGLKPVILVVDDTPDNIILVSGLLKNDYRIKVATNGEKALVEVTRKKPDLILLDIMMPVMDGYETCRRLQASSDFRDIPIIFLTAKSEVEDEFMGLEMGAVDYITKPISPPILMARVKTHIQLKHSKDELKLYTEYLEETVAQRTKSVGHLQELSIMAMSALAEARDNETGFHIHRTKLYGKILIMDLWASNKALNRLDSDDIKMIVASFPLHDIGKVGIPDNVLLKPGKLNSMETEIMRNHTRIGLDALLRAETMLAESDSFLKYAKEIVFAHHERWDGFGYPQKLKGDAIPISARIMALADVYDALRSKRVYKEAFSHEATVELIINEKGKHFDPDVVDAFLRNADEFCRISNQFI